MNVFRVPQGALTALVTPFRQNGNIDWHGLGQLTAFQRFQGVSGIVPVGTTGESPTLTEIEHHKIIETTIKENIFVLPGCGSNCTAEAMGYVSEVAQCGGKAVLVVDPYYNGPSSKELMEEYYAPIANAFPDIAIIPYIIPGRTGCKLQPEDLAELNRRYPNVCAVKEATGDLQNMMKTRLLTSPEFQIFSGDDDKTFEMMLTPTIAADGVISVISNIAPASVQKMCQAILREDVSEAEKIRNQLEPLFKVVTVLAERKTPDGIITDKFRNPLPIKTMMNGLGMPAGPCRQPLGKMTAAGVQKVREALSIVWMQSPEVLLPIEVGFDVKIGEQLANNDLWVKLSYGK